MHYRHSYHAGNFADVFKHVVLCGLLAALNRKDKPWCYLETHAGAGAYDLAGEGATRTGEWRDGIGRLFPSPACGRGVRGEGGRPWPLDQFLDVVRSLNPNGELRHYPGSPLFARALARERDRLVLCEKVPEVFADLKANVPSPAKRERDRERAAKIDLHQRDGYEAAALLPPAEKRGLVLVDPPFERPDEFEAVADLLEKSLGRFAGGIHAVWYPLKNRHAAGRFERRVARACDTPPLRLLLENGAPGEGQMRACAVLVVNAPYGFARDCDAAGRLLAQALAQGRHAAYASGELTAAPGSRKNADRRG
jgi:23S rRNA (adenine2030-N6)-methyltransferase